MVAWTLGTRPSASKGVFQSTIPYEAFDAFEYERRRLRPLGLAVLVESIGNSLDCARPVSPALRDDCPRPRKRFAFSSVERAMGHAKRLAEKAGAALTMETTVGDFPVGWFSETIADRHRMYRFENGKGSTVFLEDKEGCLSAQSLKGILGKRYNMDGVSYERIFGSDEKK